MEPLKFLNILLDNRATLEPERADNAICKLAMHPTLTEDLMMTLNALAIDLMTLNGAFMCHYTLRNTLALVDALKSTKP